MKPCRTDAGAVCDVLVDCCFWGADTAYSLRLLTPGLCGCRKRIYCVLTSPHVNKNAREHFEIRTHKRIIDVRDLPTETIDKLFSLEIPAGVSVKVET